MMNHMPAVRRFQAGDAPAVAAIIRGLPDYFTEDVPDKVERVCQPARGVGKLARQRKYLRTGWLRLFLKRVCQFATASGRPGHTCRN